MEKCPHCGGSDFRFVEHYDTGEAKYTYECECSECGYVAWQGWPTTWWYVAFADAVEETGVDGWSELQKMDMDGEQLRCAAYELVGRGL